jgi:hypothetical protein
MTRQNKDRLPLMREAQKLNREGLSLTFEIYTHNVNVPCESLEIRRGHQFAVRVR